jgi:hypothetical protein
LFHPLKRSSKSSGKKPDRVGEKVGGKTTRFAEQISGLGAFLLQNDRIFDFDERNTKISDCCGEMKPKLFGP